MKFPSTGYLKTLIIQTELKINNEYTFNYSYFSFIYYNIDFICIAVYIDCQMWILLKTFNNTKIDDVIFKYNCRNVVYTNLYWQYILLWFTKKTRCWSSINFWNCTSMTDYKIFRSSEDRWIWLLDFFI